MILVCAGATVPADCRILGGEHLEADESSLTGESMPVRKGVEPVVAPVVAERSSMLYEGTSIAAGNATAVVIAVGSDTEARSEAPGSSVRRRKAASRPIHSLLAATIPVSLLSGAGVVAVGLLRGPRCATSSGPG